MTQVSKQKLDKEVWRKIWGKLVLVWVVNNDKKKVEVLLEGLLTETEKIVLAKRMMVGILLRFGWVSYDIASLLKLSISTVYKYKALFDRNRLYVEVLEESFPKEVIEKFSIKSKKQTALNELGRFLDDVFEGYRDRSRLIYGKIPEVD